MTVRQQPRCSTILAIGCASSARSVRRRSPALGVGSRHGSFEPHPAQAGVQALADLRRPPPRAAPGSCRADRAAWAAPRWLSLHPRSGADRSRRGSRCRARARRRCRRRGRLAPPSPHHGSPLLASAARYRRVATSPMVVEVHSLGTVVRAVAGSVVHGIAGPVRRRRSERLPMRPNSVVERSMASIRYGCSCGLRAFRAPADSLSHRMLVSIRSNVVRPAGTQHTLHRTRLRVPSLLAESGRS